MEIGAGRGDHLAHALDADDSGERYRGTRIPLAGEEFGAVESEGAHTDRHLSGRGLGDRTLNELENLRTAGTGDDNGAHVSRTRHAAMVAGAS